MAKSEPLRLLARSKLSDATIKRIIRCFADRKTPKEAMAICDLSHVTIYRIYACIRQRLLYVGLFTSQDTFIDHENQGEEEGPHFDWQGFSLFITARLGARRGIRPHNRDLYVSQAIFEFENRYSARQLFRLIMLAIKATGPLNRPPKAFDQAALKGEIFRLHLADIRKLLREAKLGSEPKSDLMARIGRLESQADDFVAGLGPVEPPKLI